MRREDVPERVKRDYMLTDQHVDNLLKLRDLLLTLPPPTFSMMHFVRAKKRVNFSMYHDPRMIAKRGKKSWYSAQCQTSCCALGLAAINGVGMRDDCSSFAQYSARAFGIARADRAWTWLFAGEWAETDNTPEGAATRIEWLLTKGVPESFFFQLSRYAPLCYAEELT